MLSRTVAGASVGAVVALWLTGCPGSRDADVRRFQDAASALDDAGSPASSDATAEGSMSVADSGPTSSDGTLDTGATTDASTESGLVEAGPVEAGNEGGPFDASADTGTDAGLVAVDIGGVGFAGGGGNPNGSCAALSDGTMWTWGGNTYLNPTTVTTPGPVVTASMGNLISCAVTSAGAVWCQGDDTNDGLGFPVPSDAGPDYPATQIISSGATVVRVGYYDSCAIVNGTVECWGSGDVQGNYATSRSPQVQSIQGLPSGASAIAVGEISICAVVSGAVYCWGNNVVGQDGNELEASTYAEYTPAVVVGLSQGATDVAAGAEHACAVVNGGVWCWGLDSTGEIGSGAVGPYVATPTQVAGITGATSITASGGNTCAVAAGVVYCWGSNSVGQNGPNGSTSGPKVDTSPVEVTGLPPVSKVASGDNLNCALTTVGTVYCWGEGYATPVQIVFAL
jgi:alpha-tubulin suppressor-like RCC1 family protein